MSEPPLSTKAGLDISDFKAGLSQLNRDIRALNSEFKATAATFGDWSASATGVESRISFLTKSIDLQKQRVEQLNGAYAKQVALTGENSNAATEWKTKLNNATAELNKMEREVTENEQAITDMKIATLANTDALDRSLRILKSGFDANAASMDDWSKSAEGLRSRIEFLDKATNLQYEKVIKLTEAYKAQVAATGENSEAAQELKIQINGAEEEINKMEREATENEKALKNMTSSSKDATKATKDLGTESKTLIDILNDVFGGIKVAVVALSIMVGAIAAVAGSITALVFSSAQSSAALNDLSLQTGITTERLQELAYAGDQIGTSQETIVGSLTKLTRSMSEATKQTADFGDKQRDASVKVTEAQMAYRKAVAENGKNSEQARDALKKVRDAQLNLAEVSKGDAAAAFEKLGVSVTDSSGKLRDNEAVFADAIDALGKISNETERDALAMQIFGKSAQELNPLIKAGSAELAAMSKQAREMGAVVSDETTQAFAAFQDTLDGLSAGLKGTLTTMAAAFLPGFQAMFDKMGGYLQTFSDIVTGADGDIGTIATGVAGLLKTIAQDIAAQAPTLLKSGLDIITTIATALGAAIPELLPVAVEIIMSLVNFIIANLPAMIEAGLKLVITLADGLTKSLPALIPAVTQAIVTIVQSLVKNIPSIVKAASNLIIALAQGLVDAVPVLYPAIPVILNALLTAFAEMQPALLEAGGELLTILAKGLVDNFPIILKAGVDTVGILLQALFSQDVSLQKVGGWLISAIGDGIKSGWDALVKNVIGNFKSLLDRLKKLLAQGVGDSGSAANDAGANYAKDMAAGFSGEMRRMNNQLGAAANSASSVLDNTPRRAAANVADGGAALVAGGVPGGTAPGSLTIHLHLDGRIAKTERESFIETMADTLPDIVVGRLTRIMQEAPG